MAKTLPVIKETVLAILNLKSAVDDNSVMEKHVATILLWFKQYVNADDYTAVAVDEEPAEPDTDQLARKNSFEMAYSLKMLHSILPFINLQTAGEGIIKTTGIDSNRTSVLTGKEIEEFQNKLLIRCLETIEDYLNDDGTALMVSLSEPRKTYFRAAVISGHEDD